MNQEVATSGLVRLNVPVIDERDLPQPWVLEPAPGPIQQGLEELLVGPSEAGALRASWEQIRNAQTGERALLRLQGTPGEGVAVTGLVFLPAVPGKRISNRVLRSIPLAGIETGIDARRAERRLRLAKLLDTSGWDPLGPVGSPRDTPQFYERVAHQFVHLKESGEARPMARMVDINQRPAKTVQGWVAEARKIGLLPPGKRGKAG
ncbi:MAG: hypothetical protein PGN24_03755 [Microbacterium arborescens]